MTTWKRVFVSASALVLPRSTAATRCAFLGLVLLFAVRLYADRNSPRNPPIALHATVLPSAMHDLRESDLTIAGRVHASPNADIAVRVTTSKGAQHRARCVAANGVFRCKYPSDFAGGTRSTEILSDPNAVPIIHRAVAEQIVRLQTLLGG